MKLRRRHYKVLTALSGADSEAGLSGDQIRKCFWLKRTAESVLENLGKAKLVESDDDRDVNYGTDRLFRLTDAGKVVVDLYILKLPAAQPVTPSALRRSSNHLSSLAFDE